LDALASLLLIDTRDDPFEYVFKSLRDVFEFDQAAAFAEEQPEILTCIASTIPFPAGSRWQTATFLNRVLDGQVTATINNADIGECRNAPGGFLSAEGSALFIPQRMAAGRGLLVLAKTKNIPGFDRKDIELAKKFSLLASHAMLASVNRKRLKEVEIRTVAAEDANHAKSNFIANMNHELRTPLNAIIGFSEFIASEMLGPIGSPKYSEYVQDINASGHHLLTLVDNILLFSKMDAGQHKADPIDLNLHDELAYVLRVVASESSRKHIPIIVLPFDQALCVRADRQSLRQILLNIIDNALKFSETGSNITIACEEAGNRVQLKIADHGCGISPAILQRIGTPFLQAEDVMARQHHGTGLGLAISLGLAQSMGAVLTIDSCEYIGTIAKLDLPMTRPPENVGAE
jgi:signal transduction histidine kinase